MSGRANHVEQIAAMTSMLEVAPHAVALRAHLRSITESPAFKGSRRSQEFLQFIVARALDGHFDDLKERVLGVELFGRSPSYDTGDDAILRVTACDVRKRLNQYYVGFAHQSEFRIELPPGSYIPEIHSVAPPAPAPPAKTIETAPMAGIPVEAPVPARRTRLVWFAAASLAAITIAGLAFWVWKARRPAEAA